MKRFLALANIAWQKQITYRFTIISYRIGELAESIGLICMWLAIFSTSEIAIKGFTANEMVTYLILGNLFVACTRNFLDGFISRDIFDGTLSMFLIRPMPYFRFTLYNEFGRILLVLLTSIFSQLIVMMIFFRHIIWNTDISYLVVIVVMIILAFITEFLLSFLVGLIAFWTDEVDGLYRTIDRVKKLCAGGYFPLSILPRAVATFASFLPFAYTFFMPAQLYLKKIDLKQGIAGLGIQILWIIGLAFIVRVVWKKGIKKFEGVGL
jgi:ABC-2 type transport system permease protein